MNEFWINSTLALSYRLLQKYSSDSARTEGVKSRTEAQGGIGPKHMLHAKQQVLIGNLMPLRQVGRVVCDLIFL